MNHIFDIHMHIIPGVDDGAISFKESAKMLEMAESQGVKSIIATPHSWALDLKSKSAFEQYEKLKILGENIGVNLYLGTEILYSNMENIIKKINDKTYRTLGNSNLVLMEFDPYRDNLSNALNVVEKLENNNYIPVIAHVERYTFSSVDNVKLLKSKGAFIQVNLYSLYKEQNENIRNKAQRLLHEHLIDFIGSDAHRLTHRPPDVMDGAIFVYNNVDETYAKNILYNNANRMIGGIHDE